MENLLPGNLQIDGEKPAMVDLLFDTGRLRILPEAKPMKNIALNMIEKNSLEEAFFICDIGEVINRHVDWMSMMPRVKPFYAVKCNDSPLVLETLAGLGTGFDCASKVEMKKVLDLGVSPLDIIYANPAKPRSHILAAAEFGVKTVTFDSQPELFKLKKLLPGAKLVVRIRCEAEDAQCPLGMKFGVSVVEAIELLKVAKTLGLDVIGVSFHVGSGCRDPPVFFRAIASARLLFDFAEEQLGYHFSLLDIGGGFPGNTGQSLQTIAAVVNESLDRCFPEGCGVEIIAEPGRYYVASAFTLFAQIHSIREVASSDGNEINKRFMYYINDGIYGSFNCLLYDHHVVHPEPLRKKQEDELMVDSGNKLVFVTTAPEDEQLFQCSIWGPTCDGLDQVCEAEFLPKMEIGQWLAFPDMGAYTLVAGGTFNGFPLPKLHTIAEPKAWTVLEGFLGSEKAFVVDDLPVFLKSAAVGYDRDAVGWMGCVEMAVIGNGVSSEEMGSSDETEDGQSNQFASSSTLMSSSASASVRLTILNETGNSSDDDTISSDDAGVNVTGEYLD